MIRIISLCMAFVMIFVAAAAVAESLEERLTGTWYVKRVEDENGVDPNPSERGFIYRLVFNEDGTCYSLIIDAQTNGAWSLDGNKLHAEMEESNFEDGAIDGIFDGETLTVTDENLKIIFTREAMEGFIPADDNQTATLEEFSGSWTAKYVSILGEFEKSGTERMNTDWKDYFGTDNQIVVIDGKTVTWFNEQIETEYEDGRLVWRDPAYDNNREMAEITQKTISMGKDGRLHVLIYGVDIYLEREGN